MLTNIVKLFINQNFVRQAFLNGYNFMLDFLSAVMKKFLKAMDISNIIIFINIFVAVVKSEEPPEIKIGLYDKANSGIKL